ncbi:hypothetical protein KCP70_04445 [Salmonella enterica subsp. enterica]|nr:hypothetical protein KCP70_04445 [Salmonella enterica subsp. enterica]
MKFPVRYAIRERVAGGDAGRGVEAQTLANCYTAMEMDLEVVPKLQDDLPAADPERVAEERRHCRYRCDGRGTLLRQNGCRRRMF